jgi:hypothetical protein
VRRVPAIVALAAVLACGCGGGEDGDGAQELLDRLPGDARSVALVDLDAAREALELPEDHDFADFRSGGGEARRRLAFAAAQGLPYLLRPSDTPLTKALDHSRIHAAASTSTLGSGSLAVVETDQSFEDIAERLEREGYRRQEDLLITEAPYTSVVFPVVGEEDGLILLGGSRAAVSGAGDGPPRPAGLLEELGDAPVRGGAVMSSGCVRGIAVSDELEPERGELVIRTEGDASADRVRLDEAIGASALGRPRGFETGEPEAEGDLARIEYDYSNAGAGTNLITLLQANLPVALLYDC